MNTEIYFPMSSRVVVRCNSGKVCEKWGFSSIIARVDVEAELQKFLHELEVFVRVEAKKFLC